jgi:hypothetical protein
MATVEDIKTRVKQEGYDERAVADGARSLTTHCEGLSGQPGLTHSRVVEIGRPRAATDGSEPTMRQVPARVH